MSKELRENLVPDRRFAQNFPLQMHESFLFFDSDLIIHLHFVQFLIVERQSSLQSLHLESLSHTLARVCRRTCLRGI